MKRQTLAPLRRVLFFAAFHFAVLMCLAGLIFLCSHLPMTVINLDPVISSLVFIEDILVAPRRFFLRSWPGEITPRWLGPVTTMLNSLFWGCCLAILRHWRHRR